jgi:two-component system OmpR family sensor kinase
VTLRARLGLALGAVLVVLIIAGATILGLVHASVYDEVDRQLAAATLLVAGPTGQQFRDHVPPTPEFQPPAGDDAPRLTELYVGHYDATGALTPFVIPDLGPGASPAVAVDVAGSHATTAADTRPFDATSSDGSHGFRVVSTRSSAGALIILALPTDRVNATYRRVQIGIYGAGALVVATLALAGWWVERLGLRPIKQVTAAATAIAAGDLSRRVTPPPPRTEAGQLAAAFNVMVDEREAAENRLRRFVADASHELRTPLATISGVLELHHNGVLPVGPELDDALGRARQETFRMTGLVTDLLELADLDRGDALVLTEVDLGRLVSDAAYDATLTSPHRDVEVDVEGSTHVSGDESKLRQVIANLVANALAYTDADGHITLSVRDDGPVCILEVSDDGPGMAPDQAAQVFDRFYRADASRARSHGGSGLGLSIVQAIVTAHDGTIALTTAPGEGATFRIELPRSPALTTEPNAP